MSRRRWRYSNKICVAKKLMTHPQRKQNKLQQTAKKSQLILSLLKFSLDKAFCFW
jgi:hypothetical protein